MPAFAAVLFEVLVPLLRFFSGAVSLVAIYDLVNNALLPLFNTLQTHLSNISGQVGSSGGTAYFSEVVTFFDVQRIVSVLVSAVMVSVLWKVATSAAKSIVSRLHPGL